MPSGALPEAQPEADTQHGDQPKPLPRFAIAKLMNAERMRVYPALMFIALAFMSIRDALKTGIHGELGGDFLSFYTGGAFMLHGNAAALALVDKQHAFQEMVLHFPVKNTAVWVSPPFFAWLFAPLAMLPFPVAYAVFTAASLALCIGAFSALRKTLSIQQSTKRMLWTAAQFCPTIHWFVIGQTTAMWLSLLVWVFILLRQGRDAKAGLLFGLLVCKPPLAIGLAVGLLAARRFRTLTFAGVSAAALVGVGLLTTPSALLHYVHAGPKLVSLVRNPAYPISGLVGSFEFGTLLLDGISHRLGTALGVAMLVGLLGMIASFWARTTWRPGTLSWDLKMAATLAVGVTASPHLFFYDLMLLMLPLFIVSARLPTRSGLLFGDRGLAETTFWIWAAALASPLVSAIEMVLSREAFGFAIVLQLLVPLVGVWGYYANRRAQALNADHEPWRSAAPDAPEVSLMPARFEMADGAKTC